MLCTSIGEKRNNSARQDVILCSSKGLRLQEENLLFFSSSYSPCIIGLGYLRADPHATPHSQSSCHRQCSLGENNSLALGKPHPLALAYRAIGSKRNRHVSQYHHNDHGNDPGYEFQNKTIHPMFSASQTNINLLFIRDSSTNMK